MSGPSILASNDENSTSTDLSPTVTTGLPGSSSPRLPEIPELPSGNIPPSNPPSGNLDGSSSASDGVSSRLDNSSSSSSSLNPGGPPPPPPSSPSGSSSHVDSHSSGTDDDTGGLKKRKQQLKDKFVTAHDDQKDRDDFASQDEVRVQDGRMRKNPMAKTGLDTATDVVNTLGWLGDAGGKVTGIPGVIEGKTDSINTNSAINIATTGVGAISSTMGMISNISKFRKTKNAEKANAAGTRAFASGLGIFQNLFGLASAGGNIGLFGRQDLASTDGSVAQFGAGLADIGSGALGMLSGLFNYIANRKDRGAHKDLADRARRWYTNDPGADPNRKRKVEQRLAEAKSGITALKNGGSVPSPTTTTSSSALDSDSDADVDGDVDAGSSTAAPLTMKQLRQKRHTAKARLYAMKQAAEMHQAKYDSMDNNGLGILAASMGPLGTLLKGISKSVLGKGTSTLSLVGHGIGAIGTLGKAWNIGRSFYKGSDAAKKKQENALKDTKINIVDEYINEKIKKIKKEGRDWNPATTSPEYRSLLNVDDDDPDPATLGSELMSDMEAKRIAFMRLGVAVHDDAGFAELGSDAAYTAAFDKITSKRVNNILNSEPGQKRGMLDNLGLDEHATYDEIFTVLSGGTV